MIPLYFLVQASTDGTNFFTVRSVGSIWNEPGETPLSLLGVRLTHSRAKELGISLPKDFRLVYSKYGEMPIYFTVD